MPEKQTAGMRFFSWLGVVLGALSFLSVLREPWRLIGLGCAAGAVVIGNLGRRSSVPGKVRWSLAAIVLAVCGAAACFAAVAVSRNA